VHRGKRLVRSDHAEDLGAGRAGQERKRDLEAALRLRHPVILWVDHPMQPAG